MNNIKQMLSDYSIYGMYILKDGKRISPGRFYKQIKKESKMDDESPEKTAGVTEPGVQKQITDYGNDERQQRQLDEMFTYHAPKGDQQDRYVMIREHARSMAELIVHCCPPSRERSLALTHLQMVSMFSNASIACNE